MDKKIIVLLAFAAVAFLALKKREPGGGGAGATTPVGAWAGAANSLTTTANSAAQNAISNATGQVVTLGNNIAGWAQQVHDNRINDYNNATGQLRF